MAHTKEFKTKFPEVFGNKTRERWLNGYSRIFKLKSEFYIQYSFDRLEGTWVVYISKTPIKYPRKNWNHCFLMEKRIEAKLALRTMILRKTNRRFKRVFDRISPPQLDPEYSGNVTTLRKR